MLPMPFISIDQNSHPLWDTVPKLAALARQGWHGCHAVEDVDVAFTRQGAHLADAGLELAPERYYRSGNSDWGAALFYSEFLGRNAIDLRTLEPYLGWTVAALARRLDLSLDELYETYAGSDNWQLIGPSYAGSTAFHRVIGDIQVAETAPHLRLIFEYALENLLEIFPEPTAQARIQEWFAAEQAFLDQQLVRFADARLVDLYAAWVRRHVPESVSISLTSDLFAAGTVSGDSKLGLLSRFAANYATCARLYNEAVAEVPCGLKPLHTAQGELPLFVIWQHAGALARTPAWYRDGMLLAGDHAWPWPDPAAGFPFAVMQRDGVVGLTGKALLLVLQARLAPGGATLALPYNGSLYLPAALALQRKLSEAGLLPETVAPIIRVKFNFIDNWRGIQTRIRLPSFLHGAFSANELPADAIAAELPALMLRAKEELAVMTSKEGRDRVLQQLYPADCARAAELEAQRRKLAADPATRADAGRVWDELKPLEQLLLRRLLERVLQNHYILNLDYWNSRGALLPWCIALGGEPFYTRLLQQAEVFEEGGRL